MIKKIIVAIAVLSLLVCLLLFFYLTSNQNEVEHVDVKICEEIETPEMKLTCLGIFKHDPFICERTGNFDEYCYESVFFEMENVSEGLCEKFLDYYPRTICYLRLAEIKENPSFCEKTSGMYQKCSWELAKLLKNSSLCENIEADCEKYQCLAEVTSDISYCERVIDIPEKNLCFAKLSKSLTVKMCEEYLPEHPSVFYNPDCVKLVATTTQNISLCNLIENKEIRWKCLATLSKSIKICEDAETTFWKDFCKLEFIKENIFNEKS